MRLAATTSSLSYFFVIHIEKESPARMVHGAWCLSKFSKMMMPLRPRMPSREMRRQQWRIVAILFAVAAITHLRSSRPHDPPYMRANQDAKQSESDPQGISMTAAITDDLREFALLKAKQTPGWGNRNENEMYMYAPQEEYERLRFLYDINPPKMPLPFQSILSPTTISRLNLNAVDRSSSHTQPYTDDDVIQTLSRFEHVGFILRYSGKTDEFRLYAPTTHNWSRYDQIEAYTAFIRILRKEYWFRFTKGNSDFSVLFSTGDSLKMDCGCLSTPMDRESAPSSDVNDNPINFQQQFNSVGKMTTCDRYHLAPILQFGSGFAHPDVMPTMVTMPLWPHLKCFETFRYDGKVCNKFSPVSAKNRFGIYFAEEEKRIYDNMIPQIIWRGSDYPFLNCRQGGGSKWNIKAMDVPGGPKNQVGFVKGLVHLWGQLNPRWKAVTLSLQAELDAKNLNQNEVKPWVDFKFTSRPGESQRWEGFVKNGANIVANGYIDAKELSSFKYHADFGGGGGTTWKGSLVKLALPGVLFHHETPSYDYFHEELIPFVHYIPVSTELEDLREKYEWAEKHPDEARAISEAGTAFIKYMTSAEYWTRSFDRFFVKRLNSVIVAYSPIKAFKDEDEFMTYAESQLGHPVELIGRCDVEQRCKWKDK